jgi:Amt family ammonium transporter
MTKSRRVWRRLFTLAIATAVLALFGSSISFAQDVAAPTAEDFTTLKFSIDSAWVMLTGFLVFFMQTGFAMLEAGMISQKGVVNALLENFVDAGLTAIVFWLVGFGIAMGTDSGGLIGTSLFAPGMAEMTTPFGALNITVLTMFFFQFAFAATASTIATGAMAERTDFIGDLIYSGVVAALIYPVVVHWVWGGGWLSQQGFFDFAGSTVVHTVGGIVALVGAIILGPRAGRVFGSPPKPHNLSLATLGTMILWFGWYGFNPGSTLGAYGYDSLIGLVALNTTLAAGAGAMTAMIVMFFRTGKWDLGFTLNGSLAGLVGITAGCAFVQPLGALIIGLLAGIVVIIAVEVIESLKIDDAVGAFAVHGACGIFGTLAIGLFADPTLASFGSNAGKAGLLMGGGLDILGTQFLGSAATVIWVAVTSGIMFFALKAINRLRVSSKADVVGIDVYEHGASAWPDVLPFPEDTLSPGMATGMATTPAGD